MEFCDRKFNGLGFLADIMQDSQALEGAPSDGFAFGGFKPPKA